MEVTDEIKRKVFAQYLGQPFRMILNDKSFSIGECNLGTIQLLNPEDILVLKPLITMPDEEAIEMAKIFGEVDGKIILNRPADLKNNDIHFTVQVYTNEPKFTSYSTPKYWSDGYGVKAYQWLQSKGYDLPHYLLNGKTLKECNLCVY